jgi:hypothetical protein
MVHSEGTTATAPPPSPAEPAVAEPAVAETTEPRRRPRTTPARAALWTLAAVPVLLAVAEAIRSPRLNFNDFWLVLGITTGPDGTFHPGETLTLYNGHPIELVSVVFWLDAKLFAGENWTLGLVSVLLAGLILGALWSMLPARITGTPRAALLVALSALVFSSAAVAYFGIGMMGVQWLLGLAPATMAIAFAHRGRTVPALIFCLLASLGHGSGLPVWFAVALVAWLRRDRPWRSLAPAGAGLGVLVLWLVAPHDVSYQKPFVIGADTLLATSLAVLGKVWSAESLDLAMVSGAVLLGVLLVLAVPAVRYRLRVPAGKADGDPEAGWFGLAVHAALGAVMIGIGRGGWGTIEGLAPRYVELALLFTCALLVLVICRGPDWVRARVVPVALVVAAASYGVGSTNAAETRRQYPFTPTLAVAMHVGAGDVIARQYAYPAYLDVLRSMKVYPFTDDFTLGCKGPELGDTLDLSTVKDLGPPTDQRNTGAYIESPTGVVGDVQISGFAMIDGEQAECVLVVDPAGTVVGGGSVGLPRKDIPTQGVAWGTGRSGWQAVAKPGTTDGSVIVLYRGTYYRITAGNKPPSS